MARPTILVLGAGPLGLSILRALAAHPTKPSLSVLLRPTPTPNSARQELLSILSILSTTVIYGDLTSPIAALVPLLRPFDIVISATGFVTGKCSLLPLAQAVLQANVEHFVPWQFGVDYDLIGRGSAQDLFDEQLDVRDVLRAQEGTKWTIVSTGMFTSFLFEEWFGVVELEVGEGKRGGRVTALGGWGNEVTVTSEEDIGRLTARILLDNDGVRERYGVVKVAGDTITFAGLADLLEEPGWQVERKVVTLEEVEEKLEKDPSNNILKYQVIWAKDVGVSWKKEDTWNGRKGMEVEDLRTWVGKNLRSRS